MSQYRVQSKQSYLCPSAGDKPRMGHLRAPFPYLSYCSPRGTGSVMPMPESLQPSRFRGRPSRAGANDTRDPRAVFLGSATGVCSDVSASSQVKQWPAASGRPWATPAADAGWANGRRRSVCRSGTNHPKAVYAGITHWGDADMFYSDSANAAEVESITKAPMSIKEQVDKFRHVVSLMT